MNELSSSASAPLAITIVQGAFLPVPPLLGGAVEKVWYALGREFANQGHRVVHISRAHDDLPATNTEAGVLHRRVRGYATPRALWRLKLLDLAYTLRVRRVLPPAEVLVSNTFWLPMIERRRSRGRLMVHVARYPKGQLRLYPKSAVLQTVSEPIRTAILRECPDATARAPVVPYPLAPVYLVPMAAAGPVILYAGRLHPEKGVHLLVEAFARVASALPGWTLRVVGPWRTSQGGGGEAYRSELSRLAARAGRQVELREPLFDDGKLVEEYRRAAIFAYPSLAERGETFGLAVLEAMAAGCAPVVSSLACFGDFLHHGENGIVFNHRSVDPTADLAQSFLHLGSDASLRERLRSAAWTTARGYTLPEIATRFLHEFRVMAERPATPSSHVAQC